MIEAPTPSAPAPPRARPIRGWARGPHYPTGWNGSIRYVVLFFAQLLRHLPAILRLRRRLKARPRPAEPVVALLGDTLDEVNGIALSSRIMVRRLRALGHDATLVGVALHHHKPRWEEPGVLMAPAALSMDQPGYQGSEVAQPRLDLWLRLLRRHPVDLVEIETPSGVGFMGVVLAKLLGVPTCSHYRTDVWAYARMLFRHPVSVWAITTWTKFVTRLAGPVIVPSLAFKELVARQIGVRPERIRKLDRGVDLDRFHPARAREGAWDRLGLPRERPRFLYVGRISREKDLGLLVSAWPAIRARLPAATLTLVGDGPYAAELRGALEPAGGCRFAGVLGGDELASVYASADIFLFPSSTDTFGNSVVEALASGLPCVTSDRGGPQEVIEPGHSGLVFRAGDPAHLAAQALALASDPAGLEAAKARARERANHFTYDHSAREFWAFYRDLYAGRV